MRKSISLCCLAALAVFFVASQASAHEIWATAENPAAGQPLVAVLGYGHHFPEGEDIAPERLPIFFPIDVVNSKGDKLPVKPGDKNYKVVTESPVENGTYLVVSGYKPTYWSSTPAGSQMKPKNETPGATSCERYYRFAKGVVNIGGAVDDYVTKPIGTKLEIVPQVNPGTVKAGGDLPLTVLYENKPLKGAEIKGTYEGNKYGDEGNRDFYAKTDNEGKFIFSPIKAGLWTLAVEVREPYPDKAVCDDEAGDATLTFLIN
jgi:uncharacterized GH25 family protein